MVLGSIIEGEGYFGATFGVKKANLHGVVQLFSSGQTATACYWIQAQCSKLLILVPFLVQCISNCCVLPTVFFLIKNNVQVRHAQRMFQYPSWSYDYSMVKIEREYMEMKEKDDYWYSSYNSNSEVTKYFHLSTFKAILVT